MATTQTYTTGAIEVQGIVISKDAERTKINNYVVLNLKISWLHKNAKLSRCKRSLNPEQ